MPKCEFYNMINLEKAKAISIISEKEFYRIYKSEKINKKFEEIFKSLGNCTNLNNKGSHNYMFNVPLSFSSAISFIAYKLNRLIIK